MSAGRPTTYQIDQVVENATQVFWQQGYNATSMADLLAATHLSRSSLYQAFSGKQDLFRRCLHHYCDDLAEHLHGELEKAANGRVFIEQTFLGVARRADDPALRHGCLAMNTAIELGHTDSLPARAARAGLQQIAGVFEEAVRDGQDKAVINRETDARSLGNYLVSSMCGLRMLIKCGVDSQEAERVAGIILDALDCS